MHRPLALFRWLVLVLVGLCAFPAAAQFKLDPVNISAEPGKTIAAPGDTFPIVVVLNHTPGWHTHTNAPEIPKSWGDFPATATAIEPSTKDVGVTFGQIQWPKTHEIKIDLSGSGKPEPYKVFDGAARIYIPVRIGAYTTPGTRTVKLAISYQACNDKVCDQPQDTEVTVTFTVGAPAVAHSDAALFAAYNAEVGSKSFNAKPAPTRGAANPDKPAKSSGAALSTNVSDYTIVSCILLAIVGGFVLNLTPCVLPVIPIKVIGVQKAAGESRARHLVLGFTTALGVIAFWFTLGLLIVSFKVLSTTNQLFGNPYFLLGVGGFIAFMSLGMFNVFVINLPTSVYNVQPKLDTIHGSLLFGVMTAILGTPCFGPFAGGAAAWAIQQPTYVSLPTFAALGFGMSLPFIVFAIWPKLTNFIPRTGPASELVKQVMGLLMLGAGVYFLSTGVISLIAEMPYLASVIHWWLVFLFALAAGAWLIHETFKITPSVVRRGIFTLIGLALIVPMFWWSYSQTEDAQQAYANRNLWREYTPEALAQATSQRKAVVLDFTAEWCLNCKALEAAVLRRDDVKAALGGPSVVALKVDLTSRKAPGWQKLQEIGELGIPLLVVIDQAGNIQWRSNAYTPGMVLEQLNKATGAMGAAGVTAIGPADGKMALQASQTDR